MSFFLVKYFIGMARARSIKTGMGAPRKGSGEMAKKSPIKSAILGVGLLFIVFFLIKFREGFFRMGF